MKTNVPIETPDPMRIQLANLVDGRVTSRKISRKEITAICQQHIAGLVNVQATATAELPAPAEQAQDPRYIADPDDIPLMAQPDNPRYVYGWNNAKKYPIPRSA